MPLIEFLLHIAALEARASLVAQMVNNLPAMQETQVLNTWVGKIPWRRKWQLAPVFLPGEFHGQRSWRATVHGVRKESDMTELELEFKAPYLMLKRIYTLCWESLSLLSEVLMEAQIVKLDSDNIFMVCINKKISRQLNKFRNCACSKQWAF